MIARTGLAFVALCLALPARADFIETEWLVSAFSGEAWFIDPAATIGASQYFESGYAEGVFYSCDFAGQSMVYTPWSVEDFLANPEFADFARLTDPRLAQAEELFVHRITCEGSGDPALRRTLYPFVTTNGRDVAFYPFEGGIFTLEPVK
ncbi:hypothetical protein G5V65_10060 [Rhodobacter sp. HX-7-19]|uniref:YHS domain-containing protein n=1 Tax=Paragemmobacter kunshanensis TaxID=2583234 RepID=A0A6M1TYM2_9RHOB|nr:hypothetical protein [Rhodobacter kunshanensis]NGQ91242.1 hypothetical protein [Rhodobacter kunshanensis]